MPNPTKPYFAYGLNMDISSMLQRCPAAELRGVARVDGYRFLINRFGVATIARASGSKVFGVVWMLTTWDEGVLDRFEGVAEGFYGKRLVKVSGGDRQRLAMVYVSRDVRPGTPRDGYLEIVLDSALKHQLPTTYQVELASWMTYGTG